MDLSKFSEEILCNFNYNPAISDFEEKLQKLWSCDWFGLLHPSTAADSYKCNVEKMKKEKWDLLASAISCIFAFVQENFTGPRLKNDYSVFIKKHWSKHIKAIEQQCLYMEDLNPNVNYFELLLVAESLINSLFEDDFDSIILMWWKLRILCIYQRVLEELTENIYAEFCRVVELICGSFDQIDNLEAKALLLVEIGLGFLTFHRIRKSEEYLAQACKLIGVELTIEGVLGVRTKFQQKALPQLCLKVQHNTPIQLPHASKTNGKTVLPKLLALEDDVLLEKVRFVSEEDNATLTLPSIIQLVVFAKVKLLLRSQPKGKLADEEMEPYVSTLLHQDHGPLSVRLGILLVNLRREKDNKRTVERCLKQCEEVLKIIEGEKFTIFERFSYGFGMILSPRWEVQKQLADLMVSLGLIKSALDLYLEIQDWEEVVECYSRLNLKHKAIQIIQQELDKKPSVKLYCLLGDATDDESWYEKAWKFSKETSGRAQRHWACYYFAKKDYENALPHLLKSVELNSLEDTVWLRLGYTALMLQKWELAVHAYLTYTHIEPYGFESWNNLAKALIHLGDKNRAHKMLTEALKCNYNNWKVWENYMLVSADTGNFEDVLNAYIRLNELKEKFIDLEVIEIAANAIAKDAPDAQGRSSQRLRQKCSKLLAHQCVQHPSEYKLWELAALLADSPLSRGQKLQKCYLSYTQRNTSWVNTKETCLTAMDICKKLCESSLKAIDNHSDAEKSIVVSQLSSARLTVQACVRIVENHPEKWDDIQGSLEELKSYFQKATDELRRRI